MYTKRILQLNLIFRMQLKAGWIYPRLSFFYTFSYGVILQRLMPFYRLRQTGESTTLLPTATHIDIATAMTLWILGIGTSFGVCHPSMTTKVMEIWTIMQHLPLTFFTPPLSTSFFSASCRFIGGGRLENPRLCCQRQRILTLLPQRRYGFSPTTASRVWWQE